MEQVFIVVYSKSNELIIEKCINIEEADSLITKINQLSFEDKTISKPIVFFGNEVKYELVTKCRIIIS